MKRSQLRQALKVTSYVTSLGQPVQNHKHIHTGQCPSHTRTQNAWLKISILVSGSKLRATPTTLLPLPYSPTHSPRPERLIRATEGDGRRRLAGGSHVQGDVGVQLRLLRGQLAGETRVALGLLDLQLQHVGLQLQDLVLDLAHLQRDAGRRRGSARRGDGVVEAARRRLGVLADLGRRRDDGEVRGGDTREVGLIDLPDALETAGIFGPSDGRTHGELGVDLGEGVSSDAAGDREIIV